MTFEKSFDYIITGAGASGCPIANRLSANPNISVLLLEAGGPDTDPTFRRLDVPALFELWQPPYDWGFSTEEEQGLDGRRMPFLQGKVLGGSSSTNGRIFIRGNRRDFDYWNYLGNEGWSYKDVLHYFKKFEDYEGGESEYHGVGGPVSIRELPNPTPAAQAFVQACVELGYKGPPWDFNGAVQEGAGMFTQSTTTRQGTRASTAVAYIHPIRDRRNLTVETNAFTTRVLMEGDQAVGVEYIQGGTSHKVGASTEVIVSAGAFLSPKLLMLSGIGPADHLRSHGVPVVVDLPGVGKNLQDHLIVRLCFSSRGPQPVPDIISEACLFTYTRGGLAAASPNLQFFFGGFVFPEVGKGPGFTTCPLVTQPQSVGSLSLRSNNPLDPPVIRMNYFSSDLDMKVLLHGMALGRELIHARAFDEMRGEELLPGADVKTEEALRAYIRRGCITDWHPSCSCKMGHDRDAVVDPQLRVHGVRGLRVADASIMPRITNCNLNSSCIMIGEKASDLILADQTS